METSCKQAELWISIRADGEWLGDDDARRLDEHLEVCVECRRALAAEMRRTALVGAALEDPEADERLSEAVLEALRRDGQERIGPSRRSWSPVAWGRWPAAAAAALAIAVGAWQLAPRGASPVPSPAAPSPAELSEPFILILESQESVPDWRFGREPRLRQGFRRNVITVPRDPLPGETRLRLESEEGRVRFVDFKSLPHY